MRRVAVGFERTYKSGSINKQFETFEKMRFLRKRFIAIGHLVPLVRDREYSRVKPYVGAALSCVLGSCSFLVPTVFSDLSGLDITLARYIVFGLFSSVWYVLTPSRLFLRKSLAYAIASNVGYYFLVVLAVHYSGPVLTAILISGLPATICLGHTIHTRTRPSPSILFACLLLLAGVILFHFREIASGALGSGTVKGVAFALLALISWTWFAIDSAQRLSRLECDYRTLTNSIGLSSGALGLVIASMAAIFAKHALPGHALMRLALVGLILGVGTSWLGLLLWNRALESIPVRAAGFFVILEPITVFLISFTFGLDSFTRYRVAGALLMLVGSCLGIAYEDKNQPAQHD